MSKRMPLSTGPSPWPPRLYHTASQHPYHPLQLTRPPLRPRHTRLYHPLHKLARHCDIHTFLALVCSSRRLALLAPRPSLAADSFGAAQLPSRECVPMAKARACIGGRSWQRLTRASFSRLGLMREEVVTISRLPKLQRQKYSSFKRDFMRKLERECTMVA